MRFRQKPGLGVVVASVDAVVEEVLVARVVVALVVAAVDVLGAIVVVVKAVMVVVRVTQGPGVHWYNAGFGTPGTILVVFAH